MNDTIVAAIAILVVSLLLWTLLKLLGVMP